MLYHNKQIFDAVTLYMLNKKLKMLKVVVSMIVWSLFLNL